MPRMGLDDGLTFEETDPYVDETMNMLKRRILDTSTEPATFVAPSTKIVGELSGKGNYVFCGTVEGECDVEGPVTLAEGCHWSGVVRATDVIISGTVEGDVIARQRVEVAGTARITGSLSGKSIAVAEGAVIEGDINVTNGNAPIKFREKRQGSA